MTRKPLDANRPRGLPKAARSLDSVGQALRDCYDLLEALEQRLDELANEVTELRVRALKAEKQRKAKRR